MVGVFLWAKEVAEDSVVKQHSSNDIWNRVNEQATAIAHIAAAQAGTEAKLNALSEEVRSGFGEIKSELNKANRKDPPNYIALIMLSLGMLGMFGGYALLITSPIHSSIDSVREGVERNYQQVTALEAHRQRTAANEAKIEMLEKQWQVFDQFMVQAHYIHGQREELGRRVEDIDNLGSRRWNEQKPVENQ